MNNKIKIDDVNIYDTIIAYDTTVITDGELIENCEVQIWRNSVTGKESVGWVRKPTITKG